MPDRSRRVRLRRRRQVAEWEPGGSRCDAASSKTIHRVRVSHVDVAGRRRIGLAIVGGLGVAAVGAWLVLAPARSRGSAAKGPYEPESAAQTDPTLPGPDLAATPAARTPQISSLDAGDEAEQKARRIIADSRAAYAACDTYEDDGTYDLVFRGDAGFSEETEFHTAVAGPNAIRFAYRGMPTQFGGAKLTQLVADDAGVLIYDPWSHEPLNGGSLSLAIGGLRGVSHGLQGAVLSPSADRARRRWRAPDRHARCARRRHRRDRRNDVRRHRCRSTIRAAPPARERADLDRAERFAHPSALSAERRT